MPHIDSVRLTRSRRAQAQAGFTLIEVLVATMILGLIITAVLGPLTGMFGLTRKSMSQTDATSVAQATLEDVRGQWLNWSKYDAGCVTGDAFPTTVGVSVMGWAPTTGVSNSIHTAARPIMTKLNTIALTPLLLKKRRMYERLNP